MKVNTKRVSIGIPPGLYEVLEKLAAEKKRTVPSYIRCLLWQHMEDKGISVPLFPGKRK